MSAKTKIMTIYTIVKVSLADGTRSQVRSPFSSRRKAIACAEESKTPGSYCIVQASETGVTPHLYDVHQTGAG